MSNLIIDSQNKLYIINNNALELKNYIQFEDQEVRRICAEAWGDGFGITPEQAAAVTSLSSRFTGNTSITSFNELEYFTGLTNINGQNATNGAFNGCTGLTKITIPENVTAIQYGAFYGAENLSEITIKGKSKNLAVGVRAFNKPCYVNRINLDDIERWCRMTWDNTGIFNYSGNARSIRLYKDGVEITSVDWPSALTTISQYKFYYCVGLQEISILSAISSTGSNSFANCTSMSRINIGTLEQYLGITWNGTGGHPFTSNSSGGDIYINDSKITNVTIPSSITAIKSQAFFRTNSLESVTFHNNITSIGSSAFLACKKLTNISIPTSVTSIGSSAFNYCSALTGDITLSNVTSIGASAFANTKITNFINSASCSYGNYVFQNTKTISNITITPTSNATASWFNACGNSSNPGVLTINGNYNGNGNWGNSYFKKIIVSGNLSSGFGTYLYSVSQIRIGGNCSGSTTMGLCYSSGSAWKFFEVMGNLTSGGLLFYAPTSNLIMHLGSTTKVTGDPSKWGLDRVLNIYVGDGSSEASDQAVLNQYLADTNWTTYSSKLDTWYNYINSANANPDYIN